MNIKADGKSKIFWQGPSIGFDIGGNASKTFVLIYGLNSKDAIYKRFPGIEGSFYYVAGLGVNYQATAILCWPRSVPVSVCEQVPISAIFIITKSIPGCRSKDSMPVLALVFSTK